jgi:hypothetical protein
MPCSSKSMKSKCTDNVCGLHFDSRCIAEPRHSSSPEGSPRAGEHSSVHHTSSSKMTLNHSQLHRVASQPRSRVEQHKQIKYQQPVAYNCLLAFGRVDMAVLHGTKATDCQCTAPNTLFLHGCHCSLWRCYTSRGGCLRPAHSHLGFNQAMVPGAATQKH